MSDNKPPVVVMILFCLVLAAVSYFLNKHVQQSWMREVIQQEAEKEKLKYGGLKKVDEYNLDAPGKP